MMDPYCHILGFLDQYTTKIPLGKPRQRWMDNIGMDHGEIGWGGVPQRRFLILFYFRGCLEKSSNLK
jgi:hypothetical protein